MCKMKALKLLKYNMFKLYLNHNEFQDIKTPDLSERT